MRFKQSTEQNGKKQNVKYDKILEQNRRDFKRGIF